MKRDHHPQRRFGGVPEMHMTAGLVMYAKTGSLQHSNHRPRGQDRQRRHAYAPPAATHTLV